MSLQDQRANRKIRWAKRERDCSPALTAVSRTSSPIPLRKERQTSPASQAQTKCPAWTSAWQCLRRRTQPRLNRGVAVQSAASLPAGQFASDHGTKFPKFGYRQKLFAKGHLYARTDYVGRGSRPVDASVSRANRRASSLCRTDRQSLSFEPAGRLGEQARFRAGLLHRDDQSRRKL